MEPWDGPAFITWLRDGRLVPDLIVRFQAMRWV